MFFIWGFGKKQKELDFAKVHVCANCGAYGRYEAFMTYSYFSIFFIPLIKYKKKYYIRTTCCNSLYSINKEIGLLIERGKIVEILESDLEPLNVNKKELCSNCGFPLEEKFEYCPKCGEKLD